MFLFFFTFPPGIYSPAPPGGGPSGSGLDLFPGIGLSFSPPPRWQGMMDYLPGIGTVLFGGKTTNNTNDGVLNDSWFWNGSVWVLLNEIVGPSGRFDGSMSFDGTSLILFGGANAELNPLQDTWSFTGTWSLVNNGTGAIVNPVSRKSAKLSYQSGIGKAILFGGQTNNTYTAGTWAWTHSNNTWTLLNPPNAPSKRLHHAQASSPSITLLFGGAGPTELLTDTWQFDGTFWLGVNLGLSSSVPSGRYGANMVYDSGNNLFILFGGITAQGYNAETWVFNPTNNTWTQILPSGTVPLRRAYAQMAYDVFSARTVLFGGIKDDEDYNDTWLFNSSTNAWTPQ